jgi:hypothetical protein
MTFEIFTMFVPGRELRYHNDPVLGNENRFTECDLTGGRDFRFHMIDGSQEIVRCSNYRVRQYEREELHSATLKDASTEGK